MLEVKVFLEYRVIDGVQLRNILSRGDDVLDLAFFIVAIEYRNAYGQQIFAVVYFLDVFADAPIFQHQRCNGTG